MRCSKLPIFSMLAIGLLIPTLLSCGNDGPSSPPPPAWELSPPSLDFGSVTLMRAKDLSFTIRNTSGRELRGTATEDCAAYSIESGGGAFVLTPGSSWNVRVRFVPTSAGPQACTIGFGEGLPASLACAGIGVLDTVAPAAVTDLACSDPGSTRIRLTWTAPGNDGNLGTAAAYDIRRSTGPITEASWDAATVVPNRVVPGPNGSPQALTVMGLSPDQRYFFALKVRDEAPNWSAVSNSPEATTASLGPVDPGFVRIPAGTFLMGSPEDEPSRYLDETRHQVTFLRPLDVCDHEVTQSEWEAVMGWNDSYFTFEHDPNLPVEKLNWYDCLKYCNDRSIAEGREPVYTYTVTSTSGNHIVAATVEEPNWDANGYRLLTEAEWEYACRAGSTTAFCNGGITELFCGVDPNLTQVGWYCGNSTPRTHDVKLKQGNAWGLYDMHGNVWEWCWDRYGPLDAAPVTDPRGPSSGTDRVVRGGCFYYYTQVCRSAGRLYYFPADASWNIIGLRVAKAAE